jgi:hypothetical protein
MGAGPRPLSGMALATGVVLPVIQHKESAASPDFSQRVVRNAG